MNQILFYLIIGMVGACLDLATFLFFQKIGLSILVSQWIAAFIGGTHNHFWQFYKIFDHNQTFYKTYVMTLLLSIVLIISSGPLLVFLE